jgi:molybdopterin synthase catalytic subunit
MSLQDLLKLIATLTPEQQGAVAEFVGILKKEQKPETTFREALDEFVGKHPELLRRLAQ